MSFPPTPFRFGSKTPEQSMMEKMKEQQQQQQQQQQPQASAAVAKKGVSVRKISEMDNPRTIELYFTKQFRIDELQFVLESDAYRGEGKRQELLFIEAVKVKDGVQLTMDFAQSMQEGVAPPLLNLAEAQTVGLQTLLSNPDFAQLCDYKDCRVIFVWSDNTTLKSYKQTLKMMQRVFQLKNFKVFETDDSQAIEATIDKDLLAPRKQ